MITISYIQAKKHRTRTLFNLIVQKIMKLPVLNLKAACKRGDADQLVDVINELFDLERQNVGYMH